MATGSLTEQVAEELEQAAVVTRRLDRRLLGSFWIGVGVGTTVGFYIGYRYSKKKLRAEIFEEAEKEISEARDYYQQKIVSAEAQNKPSVDEIIEEKGYSTEESDLRIEYAHLDDPAETRPLKAPVPINPLNPSPKVFRNSAAPKDKNDNWDWEIETEQRDPREPFVIHHDEYYQNESGYDQVSYIYYSGDDVLIDEDDPSTILKNRENLIGEKALNLFGHGSEDYNVVHVRNSDLQLEFTITRVPKSWKKEMVGLE